jgi:hypothetical protein
VGLRMRWRLSWIGRPPSSTGTVRQRWGPRARNVTTVRWVYWMRRWISLISRTRSGRSTIPLPFFSINRWRPGSWIALPCVTISTIAGWVARSHRTPTPPSVITRWRRRCVPIVRMISVRSTPYWWKRWRVRSTSVRSISGVRWRRC